ncbi:hypothetical protein BDN67DRAFT_813277 [Paxillus ammoniavirescens]|nr:hypothetical protein BDN67DRAFT_813277 [Paxillus ammoniavirescens]
MRNRTSGTPFKVAGLCGWTAVVGGPQFVVEVRKTADDELSFMKAANAVSNESTSAKSLPDSNCSHATHSESRNIVP